MERGRTPDERDTTEHGRGASRHRARPRSAGEARRGGSPLRALVLDRSARGTEDQARSARRVREPVHGQGSAVRGALGLVRARAHAGGLRPDPGARSRHPGRLSLGSHLRVDGRGPVVGGRAVQPVSAAGAQARGGRRRGEGVRGARGHRAGVHRHALARRPGRSRRSTTIRSPARACARDGRRSATTPSTPSTPWSFSAPSSTSSTSSAGD